MSAHAQTMSGLTSAFENPQFSTAIGLIKYAQAVQADRQPRSGCGRFLENFQQDAMKPTFLHSVIPSRAARRGTSQANLRSCLSRNAAPRLVRSLAAYAARDDNFQMCLSKAIASA